MTSASLGKVGGAVTAGLTLRPDELRMAAGKIEKRTEWSDPSALAPGTQHTAWVEDVVMDGGVERAGIWVCLSSTVRGFVYCTRVSDDVDELEQLFNRGGAARRFVVGTTVRVAVVKVVPERCYLQLR